LQLTVSLTRAGKACGISSQVQVSRQVAVLIMA